jgi:hypothetical protein
VDAKTIVANVLHNASAQYWGASCKDRERVAGIILTQLSSEYLIIPKPVGEARDPVADFTMARTMNVEGEPWGNDCALFRFSDRLTRDEFLGGHKHIADIVLYWARRCCLEEEAKHREP